MSSETIFTTLPDFFGEMADTFPRIVDVFMSTPAELLMGGGLPPWFADVIQGIGQALNLLDTPLIYIFIGSGLTVYVVYQLATWLLNIIT